jgi:hypothetical protein
MADVTFAADVDVSAEFSADMTDVLDGLETNLLGYWQLEEASGTREDYRSATTLTTVNAPGNRTGKVGNGLDLDGVDQELTGAAGDFGFDGSSDFSAVAWVALDDNTSAGVNTQGPVCGHWDNVGSNNRGWLMVFDEAADQFQFVVSTTGADAFVASPSGTFISTAFALVYVDYDSGTGKISCSVNEGTAGTASPGTTLNVSTDVFRVGSARFNVGGIEDFLNGSIDELIIWNRKLTSAELTAIYHSGSGLDATRYLPTYFAASVDVAADFAIDLTNNQLENIAVDILGYWPLEESGATTRDNFMGTSAEDLTAVGAPGNRTGLKGSELDLSGSAQYLQSGGSSEMDSFDGTSDFSFWGWIVPDTLTQNNDAALWGKYDDDGGSNDRGYLAFFDDSNNRLRFIISEDGSTNSADVSPTLVLTATNRYAVYAEYFSSTKTITLQINNGTGSSIASASATNAVINIPTIAFRVGSAINGGINDMLFNGGIDELACWGRRLTGGEKFALYNGGSGVNLRNEVKGFEADVDFDASFAAALALAVKGLAADVDIDANFAAALSKEFLIAAAMDVDADFTAFLTAISSVDACLDTTIEDQAGESAARVIFSGLSPSVGSPPQWTTETVVDETNLSALSPSPPCGEPIDLLAAVATPSTVDACVTPNVRDDWFGRLWILPLSVEAGFILTDVSFAFEAYSSFLSATHTLDSTTNNTDSGVSLGGLPALPLSLPPQSSEAFTMDISATGPPEIDGDFVFTFDLYAITVPVTGTRTALFSVEPVAPVTERMRFKTDVNIRRNGLEQRRALRVTPRQVLQYSYMVDGLDRQILDTQIFDGQGRAVGVPVWTEPSFLTTAVVPTDTTIFVDDTRYGDFQVGGLAAVWEGPQTFEIAQIDSVTQTSITFTAALKDNHAVGVRVYPVKIGSMTSSTRGAKFRKTLQRTQVTFNVNDNDVSLASTAAFPSFNSKVMLSEPNEVKGQLAESFERRLITIDSDAGQFQVEALADISRRVHAKTFFCNTRQRLWEVRQLLHALRGRAISFYLPTFFDDMTPTQDVTSTSNNLFFENFGYTTLVQERKPRDAIQLVLKDGTKVARNITDSEVISSTEERVQVDAVWGVNATLAQIERVEFVTKVRMNSDDVQIVHEDALGRASVTVPVIGVLE